MAEKQQSDPTDTDASLGSEAQQLLKSMSLMIKSYQQQYASHLTLAGSEWKLSKQATSMILLLTLFMSAVLSSLWILCNVALGSVLHHLDWPIYALSLALMALNVGLLIILWKTVQTLLSKVGFSRSIAAFNKTN